MKKLSLAQKYRISNPESPREAEVELRRIKWHVFCGYKANVRNIPVDHQPSFKVFDTRAEADAHAKEWVNAQDWR